MIDIELFVVAGMFVVAALLLLATRVLFAITARARVLRAALRFTAFVMIALGLFGVCMILFPLPNGRLSAVLFGVIPAFISWLIMLGVWARAAMHFRAAQKRSLLAVLSLAASRQLPLAPMALAFAEEQEGSFARQARDVANKLAAGYSLAEVINACPAALPRQAALAAHVGADAGDLVRALAASTNSSLFDRGLLRPVMLRLIYVLPLLLFFVTFMQAKIGPSMGKIFSDFDVELPEISRAVIGSYPFSLPHIGGAIDPSPNAVVLASLGMFFLSNFGLLLVVAMFCVGVVAWLEWRGTLSPRLPWWSRIVDWLDMAVVLRVLALAADRGRPLPHTVDIAADYYPKPQLRDRLCRVAVDLHMGAPWQDSFRRRGLLSANDAGMLSAAERAGNLPWAMRGMADSFERRANYRLQALAQVAMPLVLIPVGILVAIIVVGYFAPLTTLIWSLAV